MLSPFEWCVATLFYQDLQITSLFVFTKLILPDQGISELRIYGADDLLYSAEMDTRIDPLDFHVDLTGAMKFRIEFIPHRGARTGIGAYLDDFGL